MIAAPERKVVIVDAARTAIGNFNGALSAVPAHILGATVIKALISRAGISATQIDEVILGHCRCGPKSRKTSRYRRRPSRNLSCDDH